MGRLIRFTAFLVALAGIAPVFSLLGEKNIGKDKIIYTHKAHLEKYKVGNCETCHRNVTKSRRAASDHYSFQEGCSGIGCHNVKEKDSCFVCHTNVKGQTPPKPVREVEFSHQRHDSLKVECRVCHTGLDKQRIFDRTRIPDMMICLDCHDKKKETMACHACHTDAGLSASHLPGWKQEHGAMNSGTRKPCDRCHSQGYCDRCHAGKDMSAPHPPNFEFTHGSDVLTQGANCGTCHAKTVFCDRCHNEKWGRVPGNHPFYIKGSQSCRECHDD